MVDLTLQLVSFSKGCTQSKLGSLDPSSTYPPQAIKLSRPSPWPMLLRVPNVLVPPPHAAPIRTIVTIAAMADQPLFIPPPLSAPRHRGEPFLTPRGSSG